MKKVLLFIWSMCLFLEAIASGSNLEINIFNVGWGNFVLLRKDNNVLVIDCGKADAFELEPAKARLENILEKSENCTVVITHDHEDHYSAACVLNECFQKATMQKGNIGFFYGWAPSKKDSSKRVERGSIQCNSWAGNLRALKCLGNDVSIHCIIPEKYDKRHHVNNLVVGIKYGNKSFIFPGDATQDWFRENARSLIKLVDDLGGVDFLLMPHHGSMSDTGFLMKNAIENRVKGNQNPKRLICVISGNPSQKYHIPQIGVQYLFSGGAYASVRPHYLTLSGNEIDSNTGKIKCIIEPVKSSSVFSTGNVVYGYKIVCDGEDFWMYDGLGIPRNPKEYIADLKVFDSFGLDTPRSLEKDDSRVESDDSL
ncbi:MAG: hypothetical protein LBH08_00305 [Puniceicoccales bacterium]|jgi:beta-lactamase superfamily II metal-dependent hydrolase|nr:hypothetical protein [Puniceicoccales bacterium]